MTPDPLWFFVGSACAFGAGSVLSHLHARSLKRATVAIDGQWSGIFFPEFTGSAFVQTHEQCTKCGCGTLWQKANFYKSVPMSGSGIGTCGVCGRDSYMMGWSLK